MSQYNIRSWLCGKTLFITGGTGFVGKVLIEKILRECQDVQKIYLLLRARDQQQLMKRFIQLQQNQAFGRLDHKDLQKLYPIRGDLSQIQLALSENDRNRLISEVDIVVHSGATIKFNEMLRDAVLLNVRGTRELANLAKTMAKLKAFIHVSTAYSNCHLSEIREEISETNFDPDDVIDICELGEEAEIVKHVKSFYPNTYIFSKRLSEQLVAQYAGYFPIAIVRPSIITPAENDPYPGWLDSLNGPMGLVAGAGVGLIRAVYGYKSTVFDLMPVDKVANAIIAVSLEVGVSRPTSCCIYNVVASNEAPLTGHKWLKISKAIGRENPNPLMVWYPDGDIYENIIIFHIYFFLFQLLPALLLDLIMLIIRKRPTVVRLQRKIYQNQTLVSYFLRNSWQWTTTNTLALHDKLDVEEQSIFNFRMNNINYPNYMDSWIRGTNKYYFKVAEYASERTKWKTRIQYCLHIFTKSLGFLLVGYVLTRLFGFHNLLRFPKLQSCGECSSVYASLNGAFIRR